MKMRQCNRTHRPVNILTVDVEDWFHICDVQQHLPRRRWHRLESRVVGNTLALLELLAQTRCKATFFILGWVAERFPDLVREIASHGHEIASHGYFHQRVYTLSPTSFERDIERSLEILSPLANRRILGYRAPEWSIRADSIWALPILARMGFCYDASMAALPVIGNPHNPKGIFRHGSGYGRLWEVPPLVGGTPLVNLPIGGGWGLRTFPYAVLRHFIRVHNRAHGPAVLFIHPCELDANRPKPKSLPPGQALCRFRRMAYNRSTVAPSSR